MQRGRLATGIPSSSTLHSLSRSFPLYRRDPFSFLLRLVRCKGFLLFVSTAMSLLDSSLRKAGFTLSTQNTTDMCRQKTGGRAAQQPQRLQGWGSKTLREGGGARAAQQPQRLWGWGSKTLQEHGGARAEWRASAAQGPNQWRCAGIQRHRAHDSWAVTQSPVLGASPPGADPARKVGSGSALRPPGQLQAHCPPLEEHSAASVLGCPRARLAPLLPTRDPASGAAAAVCVLSAPCPGLQTAAGTQEAADTHTHTHILKDPPPTKTCSLLAPWC